MECVGVKYMKRMTRSFLERFLRQLLGLSFRIAQRKGRLMKSILDPSFHYVPSASTDLRKTFARIRREQRNGKHVEVPSEKQVMRRVFSLTQRKHEAVA